MFNLEQAIAGWREQMLAAGISAFELAELESHLRDEINQQVRDGLNQPDAFRLAIQNIGQARVFKREFRKNGSDWHTRSRKLVYGLSFLFCLMCCYILLLTMKPLRSMPMSVPCQLSGWTAIILASLAVISGPFLPRLMPVISSRRARSLVQFICLIPVFAGYLIYIEWVLPNWDYEHFDMGRFLAVSIWVFAALPIAYRLCKAFDDAAVRCAEASLYVIFNSARRQTERRILWFLALLEVFGFGALITLQSFPYHWRPIFFFLLGLISLWLLRPTKKPRAA